MQKKSLTVYLGILALVLTGCQPTTKTSNTEATQTGLTEAEAKIIGEKICLKNGETLAPGYYNENSKTWWFDAKLNEIKAGCNPACVVFEDTKKAEINWRCTGLISPESASSILKELFTEKYPKYADTISIKINQETENHARGSVNMEPGAPGGIFLATKTEDSWKIVHEGNGGIPCDLSKYEFPSEMLSDCTE